MANEAQRLIAVSIGKISSSKGQRGGVNLRRNLLVANVILRARTVYMMANHSNGSTTTTAHDTRVGLMEHQATVDSDVQPLSGTSSTSSAVPESAREPDDVEAPANVRNEMTLCDKQPRVPPTCDDDSNACEFENEDNINRGRSGSGCFDSRTDTTSVQSNNSDGTTEKCTRCLSRSNSKRRLSDAESSSVSASLTGSRAHKRSKVESPECSNDSIEDMQTDNAHMSSLVHRFSEGFSGLLSLNSRSSAFRETDASGMSACSDGFTSCSTQIKDCYESISVTPIALAVWMHAETKSALATANSLRAVIGSRAASAVAGNACDVTPDKGLAGSLGKQHVARRIAYAAA